MAWALRFDGVTDYCIFDTDTTYHQELTAYYFEVDFIIPSGASGNIYFVGSAPNFNGPIWIEDAGNVKVRYGTTQIAWTGVPYNNDGATENNLVIVRDGDTHELFLNGTSYGTKSSSVTSSADPLSYIARTSNVESELDLIRMRLWDNSTATGTAVYDHDATNSDHNSLTLSDFGSAANDATLTNMTTANWIDLGDSGIVEDAETNISLTSNANDSLSLSEAIEANASISDESADSLSLSEPSQASVSVSSSSNDSLSISESFQSSISVQDASADALSIAEASLSGASLFDTSTDSLSILEIASSNIILTDNSTDNVSAGIVEDEVSFISAFDASFDSLSITESLDSALRLVDNSYDSIGGTDIIKDPLLTLEVESDIIVLSVESQVEVIDVLAV